LISVTVIACFLLVWPKQAEKNELKGGLARNLWQNFSGRAKRSQALPVVVDASQAGNNSVPLIKRLASNTTFPGLGLEWEKTINSPNPLIRKIAEIRQARELYLHSIGEPVYTNKFRYMVCAITRNEPHLKEWILRNFVIGVEHFVIYDNNRVAEGLDHDISEVLRPFREAGILTIEKWPREGVANQATFKNSFKLDFWKDCIQQYGPHTEWFLPFDTDEFLMLWSEGQHPLRPEEKEPFPGKGADLVEGYPYDIFPLHTMISRFPPNVAAWYFRWMMTYTEHRVLKSNLPLIDAFPRNCQLNHPLSKHMFKPEAAYDFGKKVFDHEIGVYGASIKTIVGDNKKGGPPGSGAAMLHYYSKSLEEWIWKKEQSFKEWPRNTSVYYSSMAHGVMCDRLPIIWPTGYDIASNLLLGLASSIPDAGTLLRQSFAKRTNDMEGARYLFFKWVIASGFEWDEEAYLETNPIAKEMIAKGKKHPKSNGRITIDGLHHFIMHGFEDQLTSCWIRTLEPGKPRFCF
jgi:hypothetical protein